MVPKKRPGFKDRCTSAGGFEDEDVLLTGLALSDFQRAVRAVYGPAVGDRVMRSEERERELEQVVDHERRWIRLLGEEEFGSIELLHAVGEQGVGVGVPTSGNPQRDRVEPGGKHFARRRDKGLLLVQGRAIQPANGERIGDGKKAGDGASEVTGQGQNAWSGG